MSITHPVVTIRTSHSLHFLDKLALIEFTPIHYTHPIILHIDLGLLLRPCTYDILQFSRLIQQSRCLGRIYPLLVPTTITLHSIHESCTNLSKVSSFSLSNTKKLVDNKLASASIFHRHPIRFPSALQTLRYPLRRAGLV